MAAIGLATVETTNVTIFKWTCVRSEISRFNLLVLSINAADSLIGKSAQIWFTSLLGVLDRSFKQRKRDFYLIHKHKREGRCLGEKLGPIYSTGLELMEPFDFPKIPVHPVLEDKHSLSLWKLMLQDVRFPNPAQNAILTSGPRVCTMAWNR